MSWEDFTNAESIWVLVGLVLLILEMIAPGAYLMFIGGAALLTGILGFVFPLPLIAELVIFAVCAVGSVYVAKRWFDVYPIRRPRRFSIRASRR